MENISKKDLAENMEYLRTMGASNWLMKFLEEISKGGYIHISEANKRIEEVGKKMKTNVSEAKKDFQKIIDEEVKNMETLFKKKYSNPELLSREEIGNEI